MADEYEITFSCAFDGAAGKGFRIYIDDQSLMSAERILSSPFTAKEKVALGKHRLVLVQNSSLYSRSWWIWATFNIIAAFFWPDDEKSTGPFFAVAEGELDIDGDAEVTIRLKDSDKYKMENDLIRDCRFHIEAVYGCAWTEKKNYVTTTLKNKRRWFIASVTPFAVVFGVVISLFSVIGIQSLFRGELLIGLFCMLLSALAMFGLVMIILKIVKSVQLKRGLPKYYRNDNHIESLVLSKLAAILDVTIIKKDAQDRYYIIDSVNDLWLEFGGSEVVIYYAKEHNHIMGMDFETMDEWALEVVNFLRLFIFRTVRFEYYFKGDKQTRIKLYSLYDGNEELIEHIRTTLNPLLLNSKRSRKEIKLIEFKQQ